MEHIGPCVTEERRSRRPAAARSGAGDSEREARFDRLVDHTEAMVSHYVYAMAALPLAAEPNGRIRFLPYARARFAQFERQYAQRLV